MMYRLLKGWGLFRILRTAAGIAIAAQGILYADWFFTVTGIIFAVLALLNISCCAGNACGYTASILKKEKEQTTYEEVV